VTDRASPDSTDTFSSPLFALSTARTTGLIVDRTGSFVSALVIGGVIMAIGATIYYFLVNTPVTEADLD